jgi:hypothetical protein
MGSMLTTSLFDRPIKRVAKFLSLKEKETLHVVLGLMERICS